MKIVCINNYNKLEDYFHDITIGKVYTAIVNVAPKYNYFIINDSGNNWFYKIEYFIPLAEYRDERINEILNG